MNWVLHCRNFQEEGLIHMTPDFVWVAITDGGQGQELNRGRIQDNLKFGRLQTFKKDLHYFLRGFRTIYAYAEEDDDVPRQEILF